MATEKVTYSKEELEIVEKTLTTVGQIITNIVPECDIIYDETPDIDAVYVSIPSLDGLTLYFKIPLCFVRDDEACLQIFSYDQSGTTEIVPSEFIAVEFSKKDIHSNPEFRADCIKVIVNIFTELQKKYPDKVINSFNKNYK